MVGLNLNEYGIKGSHYNTSVILFKTGSVKHFHLTTLAPFL